MNYIIKSIPPEEVYKIRHPILRAEKPLESCVFNGDNLETTFHLGIFTDDDNLVGVCSFFKNDNKIISETLQYQLRGMAVLKRYQKRGLGAILLNHGEHILKNKNIRSVWCNAREKALSFYKNNNYKVVGKPFNIENIGIHYVMHKII